MQQIAETYLIPVQLVLAMVGMGATLSVGDFANVVREARGLVLGLLLQYVLVPTFTLGFIAAFGLSKGWAVGLILIAVVPGGAYSNLLTFVARGNTPLSVSVTLVTTAASIVMVPLLLEGMAAAYMPAAFELPSGRIIRDIGFYLIVPLVVGMAVLRVVPVAAAPLSKWSIRGSVLLLVVIVVSSLGSGRIKLPEYGWGPPLMLTAFGVALTWITPFVCRAVKRYDDETVALSIEVCVRNVGLALLLFVFFFPGESEQGHVLFAVLYYGGMQLVLALPMALRHRRGASPIPWLAARARPESLTSCTGLGAP